MLIGLALHLMDFWAKMQLREFMGQEPLTGVQAMNETFRNVWIYIMYIVWFVLLWLHLNHGFWSAFQSMGWNNTQWLNRLRVIGYIYSTTLVLIFIAVATKAYFFGGAASCCA